MDTRVYVAPSRNLSEYMRMLSNTLPDFNFRRLLREFFSHLWHCRWLRGYSYQRLYSKANRRLWGESNSDKDPFALEDEVSDLASFSKPEELH